jgi:hypothetical protein
VPDAQLIEDVGVWNAHIGDGYVRLPDQLKHSLVDVACLVYLIAADALEAIGFDGRLDELLVDLIEVDFDVRSIELLPERHDDKAAFLVRIDEVLALECLDQIQDFDGSFTDLSRSPAERPA